MIRLRAAPAPARSAHDRPVRSQAPRRLPPRAQGALRHRRLAVRRPRRVDQHHAAHPPGHGRGGHPPRPQPLGGRDRHRGAAGRRAGHRDEQLPGRARRVLQVHDRPAEGTRRREHQGLRRRRRRDRAERDQGTARLRRGAHLLARGRAEDRLAGNDRADCRPKRPGPRAAPRNRSTRCKDNDLDKRWRALAQLITVLEPTRSTPKLRESMHKAADTAKMPVLGITGTGGAGNRVADRRAGAPLPPRHGRQARSRSSGSTRRAARAAARCSATASA